MLPWAEMWRFAMRSGLRAPEFWMLSVREWRWLVDEPVSALDRNELNDLMKEYPDA
ncbi:MAG: phage tail assembly chaperone [Henriciella sp.]